MTPHHSRHSLISENIPFFPSSSIMKDICAPAPAGGADVFHLYVHPGLFPPFLKPRDKAATQPGGPLEEQHTHSGRSC